MISVAMTTYNGELYVKKQLQSILNQSLPIDEIIICDDKSTDNTVDIIKKFSDKRIKLIINEKNLGYVENFYKAILNTSGEYIFLADQDDIWEYDKIEKMLSVMEKEKCMALCSNFSLIDADDNLIPEKSEFNISSFVRNATQKLVPIKFSRLVFGNLLQGCTYCFTNEVKNAYLKIHNQTVIHDYQIMLIASNMGKVYMLNEELIKYRLHHTNSVGFEKTGKKLNIEKKIPSKKPFMVQLIEDIDLVTPIKGKFFYIVLFYLRIPYIKVILESRIAKKNK